MGNYEKTAHRRTNKVVRVVDESGNPLTGKKLRFTQTNHEFLFGCGAFDFNEFYATTDSDQKAFLQERIDLWTDLFNYGTLPFYLGPYEPEEGKPLWESRMAAAKFMKENNIQVKGHPLCWHTSCADWLMQYDNATILEKQLARIQRDVTQFKGTIDMWDVINEVVIMPDFDKYDNAITRICKEYGRVNLIKKVFDEAKAANPEATLLLNDFNTSIAYEILIDGALAAGTPIDVIGIQSHQHQGFWGMEKLHEVLDRFASFGMPMHFTENTFVSGDLMPPHIVDLNDWQVPEWPTHAAGEERQADNLLTMLDTLFAHPQVEAFTTWDFTDGAWLGAPSGLLRKDGSRKPSFEAMKQRVCRDWHTDVTLMTDENGCVTVEGFRGDYALECDGRRAAFTIGKEPASAEITL